MFPGPRSKQKADQKVKLTTIKQVKQKKKMWNQLNQIKENKNSFGASFLEFNNFKLIVQWEISKQFSEAAIWDVF